MLLRTPISISDPPTPPSPCPGQEASTATYLLDLLVLLWDQQPRRRPSASQVVSTAAAPELTQLTDVVPLEQPLAAVTATALTVTGEGGGWNCREGVGLGSDSVDRVLVVIGV